MDMLVENQENKVFTVQILNEQTGLDETIKVSRDQYILDAAFVEGVQLPHSCRQAACVTCACKLVSGSVEHDHHGLKIQEKDAGFFLPCKSRPLSDCIILACKEDELLDL